MHGGGVPKSSHLNQKKSQCLPNRLTAHPTPATYDNKLSAGIATYDR